jgi:hypothetical protein
MVLFKHCTASSQGVVLLYFHSNPFIFHCQYVSPVFIELVDFNQLVLMTLAFTSTVLAEIMEDIRIECKELDGKRMCKPIKVGTPVDEGFKFARCCVVVFS